LELRFMIISKCARPNVNGGLADTRSACS